MQNMTNVLVAAHKSDTPRITAADQLSRDTWRKRPRLHGLASQCHASAQCHVRGTPSNIQGHWPHPNVLGPQASTKRKASPQIRHYPTTGQRRREVKVERDIHSYMTSNNTRICTSENNVYAPEVVKHSFAISFAALSKFTSTCMQR